MRRNLLTLLGLAFILCCSAREATAQQYGWTKVADPTDHPATAIEFADSLNGWLGVINENADRAIMKTSDGGYTWQPQIAPLGLNVYAIDFANPLHGWVVGNFANADGVIIHTSNGGQTWEQQFYVTRRQYSDVSAQSFLQGTTAGGTLDFPNSGIIVKTTNAGQLWQEQRFLRAIGKVDFIDPSRGWAIALEGDSSRVIHTKDGGKSWTIQRYDLEEVSRLSGISFIDSLRGWAISGLEYPWLLRTTNGGNTWEKLYQFAFHGSGGIGIIFNDISFIDTFNGWLFGWKWFPGDRPVIYRTSDGGHNWFQEFADLENFDLFGAVDGVMLDKHHGWALAQIGAVYKYGLITAVKEQNLTPPHSFSLSQNYPNPFNGSTAIFYELPRPIYVELHVHDALGKKVKILVNAKQGPGRFTVYFDGADLASGIYSYTLQTSVFKETRTMLFLK